MPLKREEARKLTSFHEYINGDYSYRGEDWFHHLIRDGVDLLEGKEASDCFSYKNGDYSFKVRTINGDYSFKVRTINHQEGVSYYIKN